jgi:hypothetical protein
MLCKLHNWMSFTKWRNIHPVNSALQLKDESNEALGKPLIVRPQEVTRWRFVLTNQLTN